MRIKIRDNGKLIAETLDQLRYMPNGYYYSGGLAGKVEGSVIPLDKPGCLNFTQYEPLGVVAIITPWNSPLMLTAWKLAPTLAVGNSVVIKPSEFTSASVLELVKLMEEAGAPTGLAAVPRDGPNAAEADFPLGPALQGRGGCTGDRQ